MTGLTTTTEVMVTFNHGLYIPLNLIEKLNLVKSPAYHNWHSLYSLQHRF